MKAIRGSHIKDIREQKNLKQIEVANYIGVDKSAYSKIEKGMEVSKGMILGRINTIGVDTDVKAPIKGILKEILVSDQSSVDFAKPLFIIEVL